MICRPPGGPRRGGRGRKEAERRHRAARRTTGRAGARSRSLAHSLVPQTALRLLIGPDRALFAVRCALPCATLQTLRPNSVFPAACAVVVVGGGGREVVSWLPATCLSFLPSFSFFFFLFFFFLSLRFSFFLCLFFLGAFSARSARLPHAAESNGRRMTVMT